MTEDFEYFDDDGYPTDEALDHLANMPYDKETGFRPIMEMAENLWTSYGRVQIKQDAEKLYYQFTTGGWSGNESVISALKENHSFFWPVCWVMSKRGGYYEFEIRKKVNNDTI